MASLYKDLVRAGIPTDNHESDLYVLDTPEARETIKKYAYKFTTFTSDIDGKRWIDVPFAYEPFWEKVESRRQGAPSGERTVKAATKKRSHATMKAGSKNGRFFFFIPQTGQISEKPPRSNYYAYQIPAEKRKFIEDWIEAAEVTSSGLEYPPGFIRTLDQLERQSVQRR